MTLDIDEAWLKESGLDVPASQLKRLAKKAYTVWEWRVGSVLFEKLTDAQVEEFEALDNDARTDWLDTNYPGYPKIVRQEQEKMRQELLRQTIKWR